MTFAQCFLILRPFLQTVTLVIPGIIPAWGFTSKWKLDPLSRLSVTVLLNYTIFYLLEFGAYLLSLPQWVPLLLFAAMTVASLAMTRKQKGDGIPWDGIAAWVSLAVWIVGLQSLIVVYGATTWYGDWYEHYERSLFFVEQWPSQFRFLQNVWTLPARGPLFNAASGFLMNFVGKQFYDYQIVATVLNTVPVLSFAALIRDMAKISQKISLVISVVILAIAPFAVAQETFTWTKSFSLAFILTGIHLYRMGLMKERPWLTAWSFLVFAAGILAHYLNLVFTAFFAVHFLIVVFRKKWPLSRVLVPAAASALLLATWFAYTFTTFGLTTTLTANSTFGNFYETVHPEGKTPWLPVFANNMVASLLPSGWRHSFNIAGHAPPVLQAVPKLGQASLPKPEEYSRVNEWLSDIVNSPSSIPGALGWAGMAGLLIVLWYQRRSGPETGIEPQQKEEPGSLFWIVFFTAGIPLNILLVRDYAPPGVAHVSLQLYVCLAIIYVLRHLKDLRPLMRWVLGLIFLAESALGTAALIFLEHRAVPVVFDAGKYRTLGRIGLNMVYVFNYLYKLQTKAIFLSDLGNGGISLIIAMLLSSAVLLVMVRHKATP